MRWGKIISGIRPGTDGDYLRPGLFGLRDVAGIEGQTYECDLLLIGPGGGGGSGNGGGGGGAGQVKVIERRLFIRGRAYAVVIGTGGAGGAVGTFNGADGSAASTITGQWGTESAAAGFGGKYGMATGNGGNAGATYTGGAGTAGGGGGGGAGSAENGDAGTAVPSGGQGGDGTLLTWWDGIKRSWATGGGGGAYAYVTLAPPGNSVGWTGGDYDSNVSNYIAPGLARGYGNGGGGGGQSGLAASAGDHGGLFIRHRGSVVRGSGATATTTHDGWVYYRCDASLTFTA